MGLAELDTQELIIFSHIITYGSAADGRVTETMRKEIEMLWNEPEAAIDINGKEFAVVFRITAAWEPGITAAEIYQNVDPRNNYFRIEDYAYGNISFVDGLGSNTGYFKLENLYEGSTTAAHEYGHTLGLDHPHDLDYRGLGVPGIMYPRGTLVDPSFQYEPDKPAGVKGGTMHPMYRRVRLEDITALHLNKLPFEHRQAIVGEFSSIWHERQIP